MALLAPSRLETGMLLEHPKMRDQPRIAVPIAIRRCFGYNLSILELHSLMSSRQDEGDYIYLGGGH